MQRARDRVGGLSLRAGAGGPVDARPTRLGRYELLRELGAGGQGKVYEAVLHGPAGIRRVAVKVVHEGRGLRREARLGGLLRHANLVDVYEVGEEDGTWFLAMEFCRDGALDARTPLPPRAVVDVGLQVCAALDHAHRELGVVHLDLKPQNLLLDGPVVKVADLGIAGRIGSARGVAVGTPGYMAPEQERGAAVDARADVYALGMTLHALATGRARSPENALTVGFDDAAPAATRAEERDLPWLAEVLDRCIARDPADRFPSMAAVAEALGRLRVEGPGLADLVPAAPAEPPAAGSNLVAESDPIVGREAELAFLAARLERPGAVTLKGPAGVGKTRLAREAARRYRAVRGAEAWFCDLAEARSLDGALAAVARALGIPLGDDDDDALVAQLGHALAARAEVLLVLDNVDAVVAHAEVFARWARQAPRARFVATSRAALRLAGEEVVEVGLLDTGSAVTLLRAVALRRGVELADDPRVAALARRLEGVPLALELAAGRLGVLSLDEVLERLSLSLLRSGRAGASERSATLRGALMWSWDLLSEPERAALAQLSVFRGGFTVEAAEEVLALPAGGPAVVDVLTGLVDRSLLLVRDRRLGLLESVREFAAEQAGDAGAAERRHGAAFARAGADREIEALYVAGGELRRQALAAEIENLVVACRRAIDRADLPTALGTLGAAWAVLQATGPHATAIALAEGVLALPGATAPLRVAQGIHCGQVLATTADAGRGRTLLAAARDEARTEADRYHERVAVTLLGSALLAAGRPAEARAAFDAALAIGGADGRTEGVLLASLGTAAQTEGRLADAASHYDAALRELRRVGDRGSEGLVLGNLAVGALAAGRLAEARVHLERAIALDRETGDARYEGMHLANLAVALVAEGRLGDARTQLAAALAIHRQVGNRRSAAVAQSRLAQLDLREGKVGDAERQLAVAIALHREVGDRRWEGIARGDLADAIALAGRPTEAVTAFGEALAVVREVGDRASEARMLVLASGPLRDLGRADEARAALEEARAIGAAGPRTHTLALRRLARLALDAGALSVARGHLEATADQVAGDLLDLPERAFLRGLLWLAEGRPDAAAGPLAESRSAFLAAGAPIDAALAAAALAEARSAVGAHTDARALAAEAVGIFRDGGLRLRLAEALCGQAVVERRAKDAAAAASALDEAERIARAAGLDGRSPLAARLAGH